MLKTLIRQKGYTITELAQAVNKTRAGLSNMLKNETIQVRDLRQICDYMNITPCEAFECEKPTNQVNEPLEEYGVVNSQRETIDAQRRMIAALESHIQTLKGK